MSKSTQKGIFFCRMCVSIRTIYNPSMPFFFQNSPSKKVKMWRVNFKNGFVVEIDNGFLYTLDRVSNNRIV